MEEITRFITLPTIFTIDNISSLFNEINGIDRDSLVEVDCRQVKEFDSAGIAFLNYLKKNFPHLSLLHIPTDLAKALTVFAPAHAIDETREEVSAWDRLEAIADRFTDTRESLKRFLVLLADEIFYIFQFLFKRKGVYPGEIMNQLYFMGYNSFPIVSLIAFLVGITISITTAQQLNNFGADIFLADLVGYGMVRELVPLMTGIILAGKIGASITAEIASMKVLEEVNALKTMGLIPEKFLMVPRLVAMTLAVPLLVGVADLIGIYAGALVGRVMLGIPISLFFNEMFTIVGLTDFFIGLLKTIVFGWLIVVSAGFKGFSVKRGAVGVGIATTESVVLSISLIIITDCIFALILY